MGGVNEPCSFPGCDNRARYRDGLCSGHYQQQHRGGPLRPLRRWPDLVYECECPEPVPGWWNVECARCRRPILAALSELLGRHA